MLEHFFFDIIIIFNMFLFHILVGKANIFSVIIFLTYIVFYAAQKLYISNNIAIYLQQMQYKNIIIRNLENINRKSVTRTDFALLMFHLVM